MSPYTVILLLWIFLIVVLIRSIILKSKVDKCNKGFLRMRMEARKAQEELRKLKKKNDGRN